MGVKLDSLLTQLGTGKWNFLHCLALSYCVSLPAYHTLGGVFLAPHVRYQCQPPDYAITNASANTHQDDEDCTFFAMSPFSGKFEEKQCTHWTFDNTTFTSTVTSELVCGRGYLRATFTSLYMFGVLVGSPLNGLLADTYGRRPTVAVGSVLYSIIAIGSCWLPSLSFLMIARFLLGTLHSTIMKTGYILAMEVTEPRLRSVMGIMLFLPWALGTMAWGGIAYVVRDWRWLQLTVSLLTLPFLPTLLLMDESPRWLAVRGYYGHALKVLQKAARWNKARLPPPHRVLQIMKDGREVQQPTRRDTDESCSFNALFKSYFRSAFILFRTPRLRMISMCLYVDYLIVGMVYYGLSLGGGNLSWDPFLYMVLMGAMEVPAYTVMVPVVSSFGRRAPTVFFFLFSGVVLLGLPFIPIGCGWLSVALVMVGKMMITSAFQIILLYSSELFPTEVRTLGASTAFTMSRVGSMCSPFITESLGAAYPWSPSVVFGATSILAGLATLALPETLGAALPDTIAHLEETAPLGDRNLTWLLAWGYRSGRSPSAQPRSPQHHSPNLLRVPRFEIEDTSLHIIPHQSTHEPLCQPTLQQLYEPTLEPLQQPTLQALPQPTPEDLPALDQVTNSGQTPPSLQCRFLEPSRFMMVEPSSSPPGRYPQL